MWSPTRFLANTFVGDGRSPKMNNWDSKSWICMTTNENSPVWTRWNSTAWLVVPGSSWRCLHYVLSEKSTTNSFTWSPSYQMCQLYYLMSGLSVVLQMITPFSFHVIHLEYDYAYFTSFTLRLIYCNINRLTQKRCMFFPSNCELLRSLMIS